MRVAVFGLGYVGSVTAACLADAGHDVVGVDVSESKVDAILQARAPLAEPGLDDLTRRGVESGRLTATTDVHAALNGTAAALICVGTPSAANGSLTTVFVETVLAEIAEYLASTPSAAHLTVVVRSTLLPGTTDGLIPPAMSGIDDTRYAVAYCPEFLRESTAISDFGHPPFTIIGTDDDIARDTVAALFESADAPVRHVSIATAESIKYASNAFHAVKITFANEMARFADAYGVDADELMDVFVQDTVLNVSPRYLRPGSSFGGSCLPKDVRALTYAARRADVDVPMLGSVLASNAAHTHRLVDHVLSLGWRRVALLGLAFKSRTDDLRESPYVDIAETLTGKGVEVRIYDDVVNPAELVGSNESYIRVRLPHLEKLLFASRADAVDGVDGIILGSDRTPDGFLDGALPVLDANIPAARWPQLVNA
ncbi:nucleotide sugar dehydrogenase [Microbacterium sp. KHB019]|uniref:nucleotide sugar dehydrogenase n=1 Tax=Microbacterium sp. KHB019 TaxID=3129770 RepID=UPI003079F789